MGSSHLGALQVEKRICRHGRGPGDREGTGGPEPARGRAHPHPAMNRESAQGPEGGREKGPVMASGEEVASWTCEGRAGCQARWGLGGVGGGPRRSCRTLLEEIEVEETPTGPASPEGEATWTDFLISRDTSLPGPQHRSKTSGFAQLRGSWQGSQSMQRLGMFVSGQF